MSYSLAFLAFFGVFILSFGVNFFLLKYFRQATRTKLTELRWNKQEKPLLGGISFLFALMAGLLLQFIFSDTCKETGNLPFVGSVIALLFAFILGFIDDTLGTIPWLKLLLQIICALILIATGNVIQITDSHVFNYSLTFVWILGIMNALNLLDNMDAIAGVVSFSILFLSVVFTFFFASDVIYGFLLIAVFASIIAYLWFNWHPSKMFMGDSGSMFLGTFLSIIGMHYYWNIHLHQPVQSALVPFFLVANIFALPIIDTTCVVLKRMLRFRKSPFIGGRDHTTHHLVYLGLSERQTALIFLILSFMNALVGLMTIIMLPSWGIIHMFLLGFWFTIQFLAFFIITNLNVQNENQS